jgi:hypothetical protein
MPTQDHMPVRLVEAAAPPIPMGQLGPIKTRDAAPDSDDWPEPNRTLLERFLDNLRITLSSGHT